MTTLPAKDFEQQGFPAADLIAAWNVLQV